MKNDVKKIYNNLKGEDKKVIEILASKVANELEEYRLMGMEVDIKDISIISVNVCSQFLSPKYPNFETLVKLVINDIFSKLDKLNAA